VARLSAEKFIDPGGQLKIERADALNAVSVQIDFNFIPDIEPLGVMVERFGNKRYLGHFAESVDKILTLEILVQFAVGQSPSRNARKLLVNFRIGEFLGDHESLQTGGRTVPIMRWAK
jgi:hypothetical protein